MSTCNNYRHQHIQQTTDILQQTLAVTWRNQISARADLTWYKLLDPTTELYFYSCPHTGNCFWHAPKEGTILEDELPEWWEMYDERTKRAYYFNNIRQETIWVFPEEADSYPTPLSLDDDTKLRKLLGPPPSDAEEVTEADEEDVELDEDQWQTNEDVRTGYKYYLHRQTCKITFSKLEAATAQFELEEQQAAAAAAAAPPPIADKPKNPPAPSSPRVNGSNAPSAAKKTAPTPTPAPAKEATAIPKQGSAEKVAPVPNGATPPKTPAKVPAAGGATKSMPPTPAGAVNVDSGAGKADPASAKKPSLNRAITNPGRIGANSQVSSNPAPATPAPIAATQPPAVPAKVAGGPAKSVSGGSPNLGVPASGPATANPPPKAASAPRPGPQMLTSTSSAPQLVHSPAPAKGPGGPTRTVIPPAESAAVIPAGNGRPALQKANTFLDRRSKRLSLFKRPLPMAPAPLNIPAGPPKPTRLPPAPPPAPPRKPPVGPRTEPKTSVSEPRSGPPPVPAPLGGGAELIPVRKDSASLPRPRADTATVKSAVLPPPLPAPLKTPARRDSEAPAPAPGKVAIPGMVAAVAKNPQVSGTADSERRLRRSASVGSGSAPKLPAVLPVAASTHRDSSPKPNPRQPVSEGRDASDSISTPPSEAPPVISVTAAHHGSPPPVAPRPNLQRSLTDKAGPRVNIQRTFSNARDAGPPLVNSPASPPTTPRGPPPRLPPVPAPVTDNIATSQYASTPALPTADTSASAAVPPAVPPRRPISRATTTMGFKQRGRSIAFSTNENVSGHPDEAKAPPSMSIKNPRPPVALPGNLKDDINNFVMESYATKFFKNVKKGVFRRLVPVRELLKWSKESLGGSLLKIPREHDSAATQVFKRVQIYMGDRPGGATRPERVQLAHKIVSKAIEVPELRDEIYCILCKQTCLNPSVESCHRGWELMCLSAQYFPPTKDLEAWVLSYLKENEKYADRKKDNNLAKYVAFATKRLALICRDGARHVALELAEVDQHLEFALHPPIFGGSLQEIMVYQHDKPDLQLPLVLTSLISLLNNLRAQQVEGIFRIPGNVPQVMKMRLQIESHNYNFNETDPHIPASVLKLWCRLLEDPIIPANMYDRCIEAGKADKADLCCRIVMNELPAINRRIIIYLINYLQIVALPQNQQVTKMSYANLAIVFGPSLLRCPSLEPQVIFEAQKYEHIFLGHLIRSLDTSSLPSPAAR